MVDATTVEPLLPLIPPFFVGKFISDAVMVFTGRSAFTSLADLFHGTFSPKGIITAAVSALVIGGFLFVDWRELIGRKKLRFNAHIWK